MCLAQIDFNVGKSRELRVKVKVISDHFPLGLHKCKHLGVFEPILPLREVFQANYPQISLCGHVENAVIDGDPSLYRVHGDSFQLMTTLAREDRQWVERCWLAQDLVIYPLGRRSWTVFTLDSSQGISGDEVSPSLRLGVVLWEHPSVALQHELTKFSLSDRFAA